MTRRCFHRVVVSVSIKTKTVWARLLQVLAWNWILPRMPYALAGFDIALGDIVTAIDFRCPWISLRTLNQPSACQCIYLCNSETHIIVYCSHGTNWPRLPVELGAGVTELSCSTSIDEAFGPFIFCVTHFDTSSIKDFQAWIDYVRTKLSKVPPQSVNIIMTTINFVTHHEIMSFTLDTSWTRGNVWSFFFSVRRTVRLHSIL